MENLLFKTYTMPTVVSISEDLPMSHENMRFLNKQLDIEYFPKEIALFISEDQYKKLKKDIGDKSPKDMITYGILESTPVKSESRLTIRMYGRLIHIFVR